MLLATLALCGGLLQAPATLSRGDGTSSIVITRAVPSGAPLDMSTGVWGGGTRRAGHACCQQLAQLAVRAFYGDHRAWDGPVSYMQRAIISEDVLKDVSARLRFYEEARAERLTHVGAIFVAEDAATREILGFADVGLTIYDSRKRTFRLPKRPHGEPVALDVASTMSCRPYLSNLAVHESQRRRGVGRLLVDACEAEARTWQERSVEPPLTPPLSFSGGYLAVESDAPADADASTDAEETTASSASEAYDTMWLEVSLDNDAAVSFYRRMGYEFAGETKGREIVRKRFSFETEAVKRGLMRKKLEPPTEA